MNFELERASSFFAMCEYGDYIYASYFLSNALVEIDKETYEVRFLGEFPGEDTNAQSLHRCAVFHNNMIYFIPQIAKGIGFYNLDKGEIGQIPISIDWETTSGKVWCANAFLVEEEIWLFPRKFEQPLLIYDIVGGTVRQENRWRQNLGKYCEAHDQMFDTYSVYMEGDWIWVVGCKTSDVYQIDKKDFYVKKHSLKGYELRNITSYKGVFWLSLFEEDKMLKWNPQKNEIVEYKDRLQKGILYHRVFFFQNRGYILSASGTEIAELDDECLEIVHSLLIPEKVQILFEKSCAYGEVLQQESKFLILPLGTRYLLAVKPGSGDLLCKEMILPKVIIKKRVINRLKKNGIPKLFQEKTMSLADYMLLIQSDYKMLSEKEGNIIGNNIWNILQDEH